MANLDFHNTAGNYTAQGTYDDYTNANNPGIIVTIPDGATASFNNLNLNQSTLNVGPGSSLIVRNNGNLNSGTININGGNVTLHDTENVDAGATIDFMGNSAGTLTLEGPNDVDDLARNNNIYIKNYNGNQILFSRDDDYDDGVNYSYDASTGTLTFSETSGGSDLVSFHITTSDGGFPPAVTVVNGGDSVLISCFLPGTLIKVPDGEAAVETLSVGDIVVAVVDGQEVERPIRWVGKQTINVAAHTDPDLVRPVRILKDALAEGVPHKDLLITPEHCMFLGEKFVPARMLVNGRSIIIDESLTHFEVYHIETAEHSVLVSDGALSESYLDTGNRRNFASMTQKAKVVMIGAPKRSWENDAAAPLAADRQTIEPLHRRLEERARALGLASTVSVPALTEDSNIHLVLPNGRIIRPLRVSASEASFMVPPGVNEIRIVSRASQPSRIVGPFLDDRRHLGVRIGRIALQDGGPRRLIDEHLKAETLTGWHGKEGSESRWTNGDARLPLGDRPPFAIGILRLTLVAAGPYLVEEDEAAPTRIFAN